MAISIERTELHYVELLTSALQQVPSLPEARTRLARFYRDAHERAEQSGDRREAARMEAVSMRSMMARMPTGCGGMAHWLFEPSRPSRGVYTGTKSTTGEWSCALFAARADAHGRTALSMGAPAGP